MAKKEESSLSTHDWKGPGRMVLLGLESRVEVSARLSTVCVYVSCDFCRMFTATD